MKRKLEICILWARPQACSGSSWEECRCRPQIYPGLRLQNPRWGFGFLCQFMEKNYFARLLFMLHIEMWGIGCHQLSLSWLLLVCAGALNVQRVQKFIGLIGIQVPLGCICPEASRGNSHFNERSTPIKLMWTVTRWHFQKGVKAILGITC